MSLQVWLPLDGDLRNQGLDGHTKIINNGTIINDNGKIGKCYSFGTEKSYLTLSKECMINFYECSISFWVKFLTWNTNYATVFQAGLGSIPWDNYIFGILRNNNTSTFCFTIGNGSSATNANCLTPSLNLNEWYHLTFTYSTGHCKIYMNGQLTTDFSTTIVPNFANISYITIGAANNGTSYQTNMLLNDFRIYDHALSLREVKELAKGLILHYRLSKPMPNLLSKYVTPGQANPGVTATAGRTNYLGNYSIQIPAAENADTYFRLFLTKELIQNNKYTFSCYVSGLKEGTYYNFPFFAQGNTGMGVIHLDHNGLNTVTFTMNSSTQNAITDPEGKTVYIMFMDDSGRNIASGQQPFQITQMKLEEGEKATAWIPNESDPLYSALGYDSNIESDCSGYKRDGIITGTLIAAADTPRYKTCSNIINNSSYIKIDNLQTSGFSNSYSFSWWGKISSFSGRMFWGFSNGIRLNGVYNGNLWNTGDSSNNPLYVPGTTTQITVPSVNIWHHFVMTGDGTNCKLYLDGKYYGIAKTYKGISGTTLIINGWDTGTSYSGQINISDFRIYCTALSADDIKALYEDAGYVDKNGNFHAYEFVEE